MVKVTSLLIKAGSRHGFSLESELEQKWRYGCVKCMYMLKVVSVIKGKGF